MARWSKDVSHLSDVLSHNSTPDLSPVPYDCVGMNDEMAYDDLGGGRPRDGRRGPKRPRTILTAAQRRQFKATIFQKD